MRAILTAVLLCCTALACPAMAEDFPYAATVNADEVYVRSGPGQSYYPTDKLKSGQKVEVYRHDPGGWYAIKPTDGSFSWVSDRFLRPGKEDLAVVTADGVASRVGSRFSDIRDVIQIRLHKGEVVQVLDSVKVGSRKWYKIAPPSGEFRWISGKYLKSDRPDRSVPEHETQQESGDTWNATGVDDQRYQEPPPFSGQADERSEEPTGDERLEPTVHRVMTPEEFQKEIEDLELKLSKMVVEEPTVWSFDAMRQRAREMMNLAETAVERGRARKLMTRMERFADIKRRHANMVAMHEKLDRAGERLAAIRRPERPLAPLARGVEDRFDGVGQLTCVNSTEVGAPRFALLDEQGAVRCYVSPAPGVNLRHYLGRRIGVTGNRGYVPQHRVDHVVARHVNLLEGTMR